MVTVACAVGWDLVSGCAGQLKVMPQPQDDSRTFGQPLSRERGSSPSGSRQLQSVPFYPDKTDQCGPATLASVLAFWGTQIEPDSLKAEVYVTKVKGSLPIDLLLTAQSHGFQAETFPGDFERIKAEIEAGHPLIAFVNLGSTIYPRGHYVVITGYDDGKQGLYIHSGLTPNALVSYDQFFKDWEKTGRWILKILPR